MYFRLLISAVVLLVIFLTHARASSRSPNIILILADDLGATDLGFSGSKFYETPNIDRLARDGMRFTTAYSACTVCSPTRASLLTGRSPAALKVTDWIAGHPRPAAKLLVPDWTKQLRREELTLPELLKERGYATASIGKWHLGPIGPEAHGFDLNIGGTEKGQPHSYFSPYQIPTLPDGQEGEFLTDRLALEATRFIEANKDRPFFLYLPDFAVHTPLMGKPEVIAKYRAKVKDGEPHASPVYAALIESLDDSVGRIRTKLDELGIAGDTIIIFTSDNGGLLGGAKKPVTRNLGLRAGKGSAYEGGVRVPLVWYWPRVTKPSSSSDVPVITADLFHTLAEIAGEKQPPTETFTSLVPVLRGTGGLPDRPLFWHYPHYHPGGAKPYSAIRDGEWRLVEFYEDGRMELYNLRVDPEEKDDRSAAEPSRVAALRAKLEAWRRGVGAQEPSANPDYFPRLASKPKPEPDPAKDAAGFIQLHARDAKVSGKKLRFEPEPAKDTLGYWVDSADSAAWEFEVKNPGRYSVQLLQACGKGNGGSSVQVVLGEQKLDFIVQETGHFQAFRPVDVGTLELAAGYNTLQVMPRNKPGAAVMDLRRVTLTRVR